MWYVARLVLIYGETVFLVVVVVVRAVGEGLFGILLDGFFLAFQTVVLGRAANDNWAASHTPNKCIFSVTKNKQKRECD